MYEDKALALKASILTMLDENKNSLENIFFKKSWAIALAIVEQPSLIDLEGFQSEALPKLTGSDIVTIIDRLAKDDKTDYAVERMGGLREVLRRIKVKHAWHGGEGSAKFLEQQGYYGVPIGYGDEWPGEKSIADALEDGSAEIQKNRELAKRFAISIAEEQQWNKIIWRLWHEYEQNHDWKIPMSKKDIGIWPKNFTKK